MEDKIEQVLLASVFNKILNGFSKKLLHTTFGIYFRDHPSTIKRRFFSVSCMMVLSPFFSHYMLTKDSINKGDIFEHLGLRLTGIFQAIFIPLFMTATLFLGSLTMQYNSGIWKLYTGWYIYL